jgi:hypothetical protein
MRPQVEALRAAMAADLSSGADCPPSERIWAAALGELPSAEAMALLDHSGSCGACAAAFRLARELAAEAAPAPAVVPIGSGWLRRARWTAVGGLAVAASLAVVVFLRARPVEPTYRGDTLAVVRSLVPDEPQPRAALILRWAGPEGARYGVTLTTKDLRKLFRASGLERPEVRVPPSALTGVEPGAELIWQVEATLADGTRSASPAFLLRLQ